MAPLPVRSPSSTTINGQELPLNSGEPNVGDNNVEDTAPIGLHISSADTSVVRGDAFSLSSGSSGLQTAAQKKAFTPSLTSNQYVSSSEESSDEQQKKRKVPAKRAKLEETSYPFKRGKNAACLLPPEQRGISPEVRENPIGVSFISY